MSRKEIIFRIVTLVLLIFVPLVVLAIGPREKDCGEYTLNDYLEGNIPARCSGWLEGQK